MNEAFAQAVQDKLQKACVAAMDQFLDERAGDVRYLISVPVQVRSGPRGGRIVERSAPGEPPRTEFHDLLGSIQVMPARIEGYKIIGVLFTDCIYSRALDKGNEDIGLDARPWWDKAGGENTAEQQVIDHSEDLKSYVGDNLTSSTAATATANA